MTMFVDLDIPEDIQEKLLDMTLSDALQNIAAYMMKIDSYKSKIDIYSDNFKFRIIAVERQINRK